jgi:hypothetical protein
VVCQHVPRPDILCSGNGLQALTLNDTCRAGECKPGPVDLCAFKQCPEPRDACEIPAGCVDGVCLTTPAADGISWYVVELKINFAFCIACALRGNDETLGLGAFFAQQSIIYQTPLTSALINPATTLIVAR